MKTKLHEKKRRRFGADRCTYCVMLSLVLLLLLMFASVRIGSVKIGWASFFGAFSDASSDDSAHVILFSMRLPRMAAGVLAGVGLSVSGLLLQAVTDNALAGPNIIGVNAGAGLACAVVLACCPRLAAQMWGLPAAAFCGAVLATILILLLARHGGGRSAGIILAGAALTAILNAGISLLTLADPDLLAAYNAFSVGGFRGVTLRALVVPAILIAVCVLAAVLIAPKVAVLCIGDTGASLLGISVARLRVVCVLCASALAGAVVSFAGLLGFVGLMVPHMAKSLSGQHGGRRLTVFCGLLGACVTLSADLVGRILLSPTEIPVGIMMACIGGPFFFYLIWKTKV